LRLSARSFRLCYLNVTYRPIARQLFGKYISAGANARNIRTSIARQRISKHTSLTIEAVFLRGPCSPSRCLEMVCITPLFSCWVRVLLSNGCLSGATVLAWGKYVTLFIEEHQTSQLTN
jgi:hypothetical protein